MTRINCIPVQELSNPHLQSEYRELPRAFRYIRARLEYGIPLIDRSTPKQYVLETGHVKFFFNKVLWLRRRFDDIVAEGLYRGIHLRYLSQNIDDILASPFYEEQEWNPSISDMNLSRARIVERILENPYEHYWRKRPIPVYVRDLILAEINS